MQAVTRTETKRTVKNERDDKTYFSGIARLARYSGNRVFCFYGVQSMKEIESEFMEKQSCFYCGHMYFADDPEYNSEKHICDSCADELDKDNPYNRYSSRENYDERKETF